MDAVWLAGDAMVEYERVPGKPSARLQRRSNTLEGPPPIEPGGKVKQGTEGAVDQSGRFVERQVTHVTQAQIEIDSCLPRRDTRLVQHCL